MKTYCFCCSLKTGCVYVARYNLKTSSLLLTWFILSLVRLLAEIGILIFISVLFAELQSIRTDGFNQKTIALADEVSVRTIITLPLLCLDILFTMYCMYAVNSYRTEMKTTDKDDIPVEEYPIPAYTEKIDYRV